VENEIADFLSRGYSSVIDMLPASAESFLGPRLHKAFTTGRLQLLGRLSAPFTCATAPINKLLLAYLLRKAPSLYQRGFIDFDNNEVVTPTGKRSLASDTLIVRHGGQPPAYGLTPNFEKQTRHLNRAMANLVDIPRPDSAHYTDLTDIVSAPP